MDLKLIYKLDFIKKKTILKLKNLRRYVKMLPKGKKIRKFKNLERILKDFF